MTSPSIPTDLLNKLAPGYREFAQAAPSLIPPLHGIPWSPVFRQPSPNGPPDLGAEPPVAVGSQRVVDLGKYSVQVMVPDGEKPASGWPAILFFHGGGWVFGNALMDVGPLSRLCMDAKCIIVSVEYRLAPEHPYPAGLNDSWDSLLWLHKSGAEELGVDPNRIAVMGISAGANLAAVVAQKASLNSPRIPVKLQVLHVPVIDASFTAEDRSRWTPSMIEYETSFSLSALNMLWLRDKYLPNPEDRTNPEVSPIYQENPVAFEGLPNTLVVVAELDTLRDEGVMYARKLEQFGVPVTLKVLQGLTHTGLAADRVCEVARDHRNDLVAFVKENL
ncbi:lipase, putative [Rhizoctonia solani AG-1 IB]|uniref:Lipase, putative n=1 Tax=Thanatephorus cucumeris (strain AG1-IB / isolate 7/3/14) TaxID=1108050 RepID=M5C3N4_THACB|nr:lipase, putative [Rhizoctonia solani AG-1 IB]